MKRFLLYALSALMLVACATPAVIGDDGTPLSKEEGRRVIARTVADKIANRDFTVNIETMTPMRGRLIHLNSDWTFEVHGDTAVSYLPFFGRAYSVPYGGGKGLNFSSTVDYYEESHPEAGVLRVTIGLHSDDDALRYILDVYENGQAFLDVYSRNRDAVRYSGTLDLTELYTRKK